MEAELRQRKMRFLRIHQTYIVNYDYIIEITPTSVSLINEDGAKLRFDIAKNRQEKVSKQIAQIYADSR